MSNDEMSRHDHVLAGLVFSLQAAAMQQLGKIQDPASGEARVDLEQARATIDVLEMLKAKCRYETPEGLLRTLDAAVMDLQLNYMEELKRNRRGGEAAESAGDAVADESAPADGASEGETEEDPGPKPDAGGAAD